MKLDEKENYDISISKGYYSPSYDIKKEEEILKLSINTQLPREFNFDFFQR